MVKNRVTVSIIEENLLFLEGYSQLLKSVGTIKLLNSSASANHVFQTMANERPDVILTSLSSSDWDATVTLQKVQEKYPKVRIVINGKINPGPLVKLLLKSGASSYFLKDRISRNELIRIILDAHESGYTHTHVVTKEIIDEIKLSEIPAGNLSQRESEILSLTCDGLSRREISGLLNISESTVKFHLDKLRDKHMCQTVLQLAMKGLRLGWVKM